MSPVKISLPGQEIQRAVELNFYCLDLLVTTLLIGLQSADMTVLLVYQGENRDFEMLRSVFDAISVELAARASGPKIVIDLIFSFAANCDIVRA